MVSSGCQVPGNGRDSTLINFCLTETFARLIAKVGARNDSFSILILSKKLSRLFWKALQIIEVSRTFARASRTAL